jgi:AAA15 family ATPase/GTPase
MQLRELTINNYRSIEAVSLSGFRTLNILLGRNNSGKSSTPFT